MAATGLSTMMVQRRRTRALKRYSDILFKDQDGLDCDDIYYPLLFRCPKALGSVPLAPIPRNPNITLKRERASGLAISKKKRKLLAFNPTEDPQRRLEQMASLATALKASGTEYIDELTYMPAMVLPNEDIETLNLCKRMMEKGECPPLMVVYDPVEGFTVQADRYMKDLTIITEYVGDVDYLKNREHDDGDSMMTLLHASNPSKSLVICPDKHGNIARFVNGINNFSPIRRKKQNVKCVSYDVNGECRVLLIANRDIRKGENLYYDYNGYENEYPTEYFV
ncbi:hypothetical protein CRYUN_Cryun13aG0091000 [Craigia yunnanensis]